MGQSIQKKIQDLKEQIQYHDRLYYNLDQPEITDYEYDQLFKQLLDWEHQYPEFKTEDSPSQKVPGQPLEKFKKEPHSRAMLSLQNSYSPEEIQAFYNRTLKLLNTDKFIGFAEPKLDGTAVELIYENGILTKALTRGDGELGENITENIKTLRGLPLFLKNRKTAPSLLEVRGEVLIFKKDFERINQEQEEMGLSLFANPRNLAAGSLRQLNPKVAARRPLHFFAHSPGQIKGLALKTQEEFIQGMQTFGLPSFFTSPTETLETPLKLCRLTSSLEDILNYYKQMQKLRHKLAFEIDGIVIKVNDFEQQKELGAIARSPRWAMAGKFSPEQGITQVQNIQLQVGRTGVVTPVAVLKPLSLAGVSIQQASLHNFQDLNRKDIRIGDFVLIHRAGDVIPEVIKVLEEKRQNKLKSFKKPTKCPVCQSDLKPRGDYLICQNSNCPAIQENKLIHFAGKRAMNIEYLGEKSLRKFYEWGWLNCYSDIYELKNKSLKDKEGFGEKSQKLLIKSLDKSKETQLSRLLFALGIPLIGEQTAQKISEKIYELAEEEELNIEKALPLLRNITEEELESVEDIGPLAAQSFHSAFQNQTLISDLQKLHKQGVYFSKRQNFKGMLTGLHFVITGTFPETREIIKKRIKEKGGQTLSQVSKKTDFLLGGENPGSKLDKAQKLGVKVLNWTDFLKILGGVQ